MKILDPEKLYTMEGTHLEPGDTFNFACGPHLECFNLCCRNLTLFLYPYDVARLRKALKISSGQFIDRHTQIVLRKGSHFPDVLLAMEENQQKTCPFLTAKGCSVYMDRPWACRTFPTEHGIYYDDKTGLSTRLDWFKPPDYCLGRHEPNTWTVESWHTDQGAGIYYKQMEQWSAFLRYFEKDPWQGQGPESKTGRMAFMATYNPDDFLDFVRQSSFLKRYKLVADAKKKIRKNDEILLRLGREFALNFLFNKPATLFQKA
ncbi:MAG: YkgJ family cysteine cluster protein [Desulfatibacillaceae bacterium]|nr:YkgJ family cysteine cluster protein [Desulfatibacillaceae bacterium]